VSVVAVIGAGKLGGALARRALAAGHEVRVAGRVADDAHRARVAALAPGARALSVAEAVDGADVVVLALPLAEHASLDPALLAGHVVVDAMNDWPAGGQAGRPAAAGGSSLRVQRHLAGARVVKSLNHIGYHDLDDEPFDASPRRALALASDDAAAARVVARLLDSLGFAAVDAGPLERGASFALGTAAFAGAHDAEALARVLALPARASTPALAAA
jgi:8-hydroxy-5-deazaflavin:NADPH oxidoreductase